MKILLTEQQNRMVNMLVERNLLKEGEYSDEELKNLLNLIYTNEEDNIEIASSIINNMSEGDLQNLSNILNVKRVLISAYGTCHIYRTDDVLEGSYPDILEKIVRGCKILDASVSSELGLKSIYKYMSESFPNLNLDNVGKKRLQIEEELNGVRHLEKWIKFLLEFVSEEMLKWDSILITDNRGKYNMQGANKEWLLNTLDQLIELTSGVTNIEVKWYDNWFTGSKSPDKYFNFLKDYIQNYGK